MKTNNQKRLIEGNDKRTYFGFTFNQSLTLTGLSFLSIFITIQLLNNNVENDSSARKYFSNESLTPPKTPLPKQENSIPVVSESNLDSIDVLTRQNQKRKVLQKIEFVND